jgi:phosphatidylglycerophosphate synthase
MLNHFPEIGTAALLIVFIFAFSSENDKLTKFTLALVFLLALVTIVVFISGTNAEGSVKGLDGVIEENIEPHQDFALKSFIVMEILGAISVTGLIFFRNPKIIPKWFSILILVLMLIVNGMMLYTAHLGGKIFHQEIMQGKNK